MQGFRYSLIVKFSLAILLCGLLLTGCVPGGGGFDPGGWAGPIISSIPDEDGEYIDILFVWSREGELLALDPLDPLAYPKWAFIPEEKSSGGSLLGCTGTVAPDLVLYGTPKVADGVVYIGSYDGDIYALDAGNGAKKWSEVTDGPIVGSPAIFDSTLIVASGDKVYAFDIADGYKQLWDEPFDAGDEIWSNPVIAGNNVYFGSLDHKLYAVDLQTGELAWDEPRNFGVPVNSTPLIENGILYIGTFDKKFYALDATTGESIWDEPYKANDWFWNRAVINDGTVYVCSLDGNVHAIDAETGNGKWVHETTSGEKIRSAPVIVEGVLVVGSKDDRVYGLDPESGTEKWRPLLLEHDILADPWVDGNIIYILDRDNNLHAMDATTGQKETWSPFSLDK